MNLNTQIKNLKKLDLPNDNFVVVGSGALAIRGIREAQDIDIIVTHSLWDEMAQKYKIGLNQWGIENICLNNDIEILNPVQSIFGNSKYIPAQEIFNKADMFYGIKFINLEHLKKIKEQLGRKIDLQDIVLIDDFIKYRQINDEEYNVWNELKKKIQSSADTPDFFPREGEVWMSSLGKNIGFEQNGSGMNFSRPILVVKKFNNHMFWCSSLSTRQKNFDFYYNFTDPNEEKVSVILAQLKLVSIKRFRRKLYDISDNNLSEIKVKLRGFLA